ncbi:MAG TPA: hypothetical protein VGH27_14175 [Streptosporangiaceae bacterium]|jgi:hypothetical protein
MNDDDLAAAVKKSVTGVHMTTPAEQIVARSRVIRTRRRMSAMAAALTAAAGVAVVVIALLSASPAVVHRPGVRLASWAVVKLPGGTISITVHELYYPGGLQGKLRADGVPASVTFDASHRYPPGCRPYPAGHAVLRKVFPPATALAAIVIHPSALPAGTGVYINDFSNPYGYVGMQTGLVYASERCTGR